MSATQGEFSQKGDYTQNGQIGQRHPLPPSLKIVFAGLLFQTRQHPTDMTDRRQEDPTLKMVTLTLGPKGAMSHPAAKAPVPRVNTPQPNQRTVDDPLSK